MNRLNQQNKIIEMFNHISPYYDFLNHFLSFNIDKYWRNKLVKELNFKGKILLDVCSGTGEMALSFNDTGIKIICDLSHPLLLIAKKKSKKNNIVFLEADAINLPIKSESIDAITIAFGLRNIENIDEALKEFHRVLKKNGKLAILEFTMPKNRLILSFYTLYLKYIIPIIGRIISGNNFAYSYLYRSIQSFPKYYSLIFYLNRAKFKNTYYCPLTAGISTIYIGTK